MITQMQLFLFHRKIPKHKFFTHSTIFCYNSLYFVSYLFDRLFYTILYIISFILLQLQGFKRKRPNSQRITIVIFKCKNDKKFTSKTPPPKINKSKTRTDNNFYPYLLKKKKIHHKNIDSFKIKKYYRKLLNKSTKTIKHP